MACSTVAWSTSRIIVIFSRRPTLKSSVSWSTTETFEESSPVLMSQTSVVLKRMWPESKCYKPKSSLMTVDLPELEDPATPTRLPRGITRSIPQKR